MTDDFAPHLDIAFRHAVTGNATTTVPRLELCVGHTLTHETSCLYRPVVCFILQGTKRVTINEHILHYDSSHYLVSALDLLLMGQIFDADEDRPYVALSLVLDVPSLAELASTITPVHDPEPLRSGITTNPMTAEIRDALLRLLMLLDKPSDIPVLAPMVERELLYRLLQGPQGRLLRQIAQPEGPLARVRRAIAWIRENHDRRLRIESLCQMSGMSRPSLHRHFRVITGLSPLQYQKQLRLQEARRLLLAGEHTASDAAYAVGYESASQFSREYVRQFGVPPAKDVQQIRRKITTIANC